MPLLHMPRPLVVSQKKAGLQSESVLHSGWQDRLRVSQISAVQLESLSQVSKTVRRTQT